MRVRKGFDERPPFFVVCAALVPEKIGPEKSVHWVPMYTAVPDTSNTVGTPSLEHPRSEHSGLESGQIGMPRLY